MSKECLPENPQTRTTNSQSNLDKLKQFSIKTEIMHVDYEVL